MYILQNRWVLSDKQLLYYGLRNKENMFRNRIKLTNRQAAVISSLPKDLNERDKKCLGKLLGTQVVLSTKLRKTPRSVKEAAFCTKCAANDFIIPGLEFDAQGRCPMCQTEKETENLRSIVPLMEEIPRSKRSRFDAGLFYTGGKDSAFMLYYLSKVKGLRVLAMTWEIPFMSENAKKSVENAKKAFSNVEFISRTVSREDLRRVYRKLFALSGNTCACPSLAYVLFYPELVANRVPYFLAGNEPVQMLGLYYNHMAPKMAYSFADNKALQIIVNIGRILTLHPPLRRGQFHTLATMRKLAYGGGPKNRLPYSNELVENVVEAIHAEPLFLPPLRGAIRRSSRSGNIPAFVHLDFDRICGGRYDWNSVKEILIGECGWVAPEESGRGLHTSCNIEKCKEYTQFQRFYQCKSQMIPFSAIEISLATRKRNLTREEAAYEIENLLGFSFDEIPEYRQMCEFVEKDV
ncbi:MAG: hypothetical protein ACLSTV_04680 [Coriobacteriales bacterium]